MMQIQGWPTSAMKQNKIMLNLKTLVISLALRVPILVRVLGNLRRVLRKAQVLSHIYTFNIKRIINASASIKGEGTEFLDRT